MMYFYFRCRVCGYDSDEAQGLSREGYGICPICAEDCGHVNSLSFRLATEEEVEKFEQCASAPRLPPSPDGER
jgi:hypothetical protein